jgi:NADH-quinone oxidoreductase subunit C
MENTTFLDTIKKSSVHELIVDMRGYAGEITIEVAVENIFSVLKTFKDEFGFSYLTDITGTDNYTDENRFQLDYNIINIDARQRLRISCRVEESEPEVDSVTSLWGSANWFEREVFDMIGIRFRNHPDLRRMYMPEDFEYYPLRKEFPLLGIPGSIQLPDKATKDYK